MGSGMVDVFVAGSFLKFGNDLKAELYQKKDFVGCEKSSIYFDPQRYTITFKKNEDCATKKKKRAKKVKKPAEGEEIKFHATEEATRVILNKFGKKKLYRQFGFNVTRSVA